jgi:hypothetical protein
MVQAVIVEVISVIVYTFSGFARGGELRFED